MRAHGHAGTDVEKHRRCFIDPSWVSTHRKLEPKCMRRNRRARTTFRSNRCRLVQSNLGLASPPGGSNKSPDGWGTLLCINRQGRHFESFTRFPPGFPCTHHRPHVARHVDPEYAVALTCIPPTNYVRIIEEYSPSRTTPKPPVPSTSPRVYLSSNGRP